MFKKMGRAIINVFLIALIALTLTACGSGNGGGTGEGGNDGHVHNFIEHARVEATCEEDGSILYYECTDCGQKFRNKEDSTPLTDDEIIIKAKGHNFIGGYCERCGEPDPDYPLLKDGNLVTGVNVNDETISWDQLRKATKYDFRLVLPNGTESKVEVDKKNPRVTLAELPNAPKFTFGTSKIYITPYFKEKIEIDGETIKDEYPGETSEFKVSVTNDGFHTTRLNYNDGGISLTGFEAERRHYPDGPSYRQYIYGEVVFPEGKDDVTEIKYNISNKIKLLEGTTDLKIYKSEEGRKTDTGAIEGFDFYKETISLGENFYYIRVNNKNTGIMDYDICVCGIKYIGVSLQTYTTVFNNDIYEDIYTFQDRNNNSPVKKVLQNDYLNIDALYEYVDSLGTTFKEPVLRDDKYNIYERNKEIIISTEQSRTLKLTVDELENVNKTKEELNFYSKDFNINIYYENKDELGLVKRVGLNYIPKNNESEKESVFVPSVVAGGKVQLSSWTFGWNCNQLVEIKLMSGFDSLPRGLFSNLKGLQRVYIPKSVDSYGDWLFNEACKQNLVIFCEDFANEIPDDQWQWNRVGTGFFTTKYGQVGVCSDVYSDGVYYNVDMIQGYATVTENDNNYEIKPIIKYGFLDVPVKKIGGTSFKNAEEVYIPEFIEDLDLTTLFGDRVKSVTVAEQNRFFKAVNGILYNCELNNMLYVPSKLEGEIVIPETVKQAKSFENIVGITKVTLPDNYILVDNMFKGCTGLTEVVFVNGTESYKMDTIPNQAFMDCTNLVSITLPASITDIYEAAFRNCTSLTSINLTNVVRINREAFYECTSLETVETGNDLYNIEDYAFYNDAKLKSFTIPEGFGYFGKNVFEGTKALASFTNNSKTLPEIPEYTFSGSGITEITLPNTVKLIGANAFAESDITKVIWEDSGKNQKIEEYAFFHCVNLTEINLTGVTTIGNFAFQECSALIDANLANTTSINEKAFMDCTSLTTVNLSKINTIGLEAFMNCSKLVVSDLTSAKTISDRAFKGCSSITELKINIETLGDEAFASCSIKSIIDNFQGETKNFPNAFKDNLFEVAILSGENYKLLTQEQVNNLVDLTLTSGSINFGMNVFGADSKIKKFSYIDPTTDPVSTYTPEIDYAFNGANALEEVYIDSVCVTLGTDAFANCPNLTKVHIKAAKEIDYAFNNCEKLTVIELDKLTDFTRKNSAIISSGNRVKVNFNETIEEFLKSNITNGNYNPFRTVDGDFVYTKFDVNNFVIPETVTEYNPYTLSGLHLNSYVTSHFKIHNPIDNCEIDNFIVDSEFEYLRDVVVNNSSINKLTITKSAGDVNMMFLSSETDIESIECSPSVIGKFSKVYFNAYYVTDVTEIDTPLEKMHVNIVYLPNTITKICKDAFINQVNDLTIFVGHAEDPAGWEYGWANTPVGYNIKFNKYYNVKDYVSSEGYFGYIDNNDAITIYKAHKDKANPVIPSHMTKFGVTYPVTKIETRILNEYSSLEYVLIPETVAKVDEYAFYKFNGTVLAKAPNPGKEWYIDTDTVIFNVKALGTDGVYKYAITNDDKAIIYNYSGTDTVITIPASLTNETEVYPVISIFNAFNGKAITEVTIPNGVTEIGYQAFVDCKSLTTVNFADTIVTIGSSAFRRCSNLTNVTLPNNLTYIGNHAFNSTGLTSVVLPANVIKIGDYSFDQNSISSITFNDKLEHIGRNAFYHRTCTDIVLPDSLRYIGAQAFGYEPTDLGTVYDNIIYLGSATNPYLYLVKGTDNTATSVNINPATRIIGDLAFANYSKVTEFNIPSTVLQIGAEAFKKTSIKYMIIPEGVETLDISIFYNCYSLEYVSLPKSLKTIYEDAINQFTMLSYAGSKEEFANINFMDIYNDGWTQDTSLCIFDLPVTSGEFVDNADYSYLLLNNNKAIVYNSKDSTKAVLDLVGDFKGIDVIALTDDSLIYNSKVTTLVISNNFKIVLDGVFAYQSILNSIYYVGTEEEFKQIIVRNYSNDAFKNATVYYEQPGFTVTFKEDSKYSYYETNTNEIFNLYCKDKTITSANLEEEFPGKKVVNLAPSAFEYCKELVTVVLPDSCTSFGKNTFNNCIKLESINIPTGTVNIPDSFLTNANALKAITIPNTVKTIGGSAFYGCKLITEVIIPDSVTKIGSYAFAECYALQTATLPANMTKIPVAMFYECNELTTINYSVDKLVAIEEKALYGCQNLKTLHVSASLTTIGDGAFINNGITRVMFHGTEAEYNALCNNGGIGPDNERFTQAYVTYVTE